MNLFEPLPDHSVFYCLENALLITFKRKKKWRTLVNRQFKVS